MSQVSFELFKDILGSQILVRCFQAESGSDDELDEFTSYLATEIWNAPAFPESLRSASYEHPFKGTAEDLDLEVIAPFSFSETLEGLGGILDREDSLRLLRRALDVYISDACAPPPVGKQTRREECEICERHIHRITYHHLIPRSTHSKILQRKWHPAERLNAVAWLCRDCHSTVHHVASNEDLARYFYTVDKLLEREDIQKWRSWASKQRYGVMWRR